MFTDPITKLGLPEVIRNMTIDELDAFLKARQEEFRKRHPHGDREKVLVGNKYYKLDGQKIYCIDCGQRLGAMIYGCPICNKHTTWIREDMLNNPAHPNWQRAPYNRKAIAVQQEVALNELKERQMEFKNKEALV